MGTSANGAALAGRVTLTGYSFGCDYVCQLPTPAGLCTQMPVIQWFIWLKATL